MRCSMRLDFLWHYSLSTETRRRDCRVHQGIATDGHPGARRMCISVVGSHISPVGLGPKRKGTYRPMEVDGPYPQSRFQRDIRHKDEKPLKRGDLVPFFPLHHNQKRSNNGLSWKTVSPLINTTHITGYRLYSKLHFVFARPKKGHK